MADVDPSVGGAEPSANSQAGSAGRSRAGRASTVVGFGGLKLAVQEHGDPEHPTVVLVHGFPDNHTVWDLVVDELVERYHVVTYDVRGAGGSEVPGERSGYRLEALIADLVAVADAISPDQPVHLVAHDWGSIQSWAAVTDPDARSRFATYTSISGPSLDHIATWVRSKLRPGDGRWKAALTQLVHSWYVFMFQTPIPAWAFRKGAMNRWPEIVGDRMGAPADDRWPGSNVSQDAANGVELYRANILRKIRANDPAHTDVPVLLLVPKGDPFVTPAFLDGIEAIAPNLERADLDGSHWVIRSHPDLVANLVKEFIAGAGPA